MGQYLDENDRGGEIDPNLLGSNNNLGNQNQIN